MAHTPPPLHGPESKRPKGILKNSHSYQRSPSHKPTVVLPPSPVATEAPLPVAQPAVASVSPEQERDIVLQNTLQNAGRRRSSSNQSNLRPGSRRHSQHENDMNPEASPRLKWDEANLYLTEQERTPKMKIDEPKTPYAKRYDPNDDEAELSMLDAQDIVVDELDAEKGKKKGFTMPDSTIPDLDIGEPSATLQDDNKSHSHSPKQVVVKEDCIGDNAVHAHGDPETPEEEEKHRKFEEMRKRHYEMKDVATLLGHPEILDEDDDGDDDGDVELFDAPPNDVPEVPQIPRAFVNGDKEAESRK